MVVRQLVIVSFPIHKSLPTEEMGNGGATPYEKVERTKIQKSNIEFQIRMTKRKLDEGFLAFNSYTRSSRGFIHYDHFYFLPLNPPSSTSYIHQYDLLDWPFHEKQMHHIPIWKVFLSIPFHWRTDQDHILHIGLWLVARRTNAINDATITPRCPWYRQIYEKREIFKYWQRRCGDNTT